jgi:hypothetical protein
VPSPSTGLDHDDLVFFLDIGYIPVPSTTVRHSPQDLLHHVAGELVEQVLLHDPGGIDGSSPSCLSYFFEYGRIRIR